MAAKASNAPASVAEGLGNVLRAITDTLTAPDATAHAGPLMKLQTSVLDMIHGAVGGHGGQGGAAGAPPPGGAPPQGPPPGAGSPPPPGGGGLMGGISGMQGQPQGPSAAAGDKGGIDPDTLRQLASVGADSDDDS